MTMFLYLCAAIVVLLGIAAAMIVVDMVRDLWR